jgi:hypothetical protein
MAASSASRASPSVSKIAKPASMLTLPSAPKAPSSKSNIKFDDVSYAKGRLIAAEETRALAREEVAIQAAEGKIAAAKAALKAAEAEVAAAIVAAAVAASATSAPSAAASGDGAEAAPASGDVPIDVPREFDSIKVAAPAPLPRRSGLSAEFVAAVARALAAQISANGAREGVSVKVGSSPTPRLSAAQFSQILSPTDSARRSDVTTELVQKPAITASFASAGGAVIQFRPDTHNQKAEGTSLMAARPAHVRTNSSARQAAMAKAA